MNPAPLFELNPEIDIGSAARQFAERGRVQIRDFLTPDAAGTIHRVLSRETPWGLAWQAGKDGPHSMRRQQIEALPPPQTAEISGKIAQAMRDGNYAFAYGQYPMLNAYLQGWKEHEALDLLPQAINSQPVLEIVRSVTSMPELIKADAQATLYGPGQFLAMHDDGANVRWRVAYVMSFCAEDWRPDWGGYLMFYDQDGDALGGFKPRFNALNLFRVPQKHNVSYVSPFAPVGRFAITGWFYDR